MTCMTVDQTHTMYVFSVSICVYTKCNGDDINIMYLLMLIVKALYYLIRKEDVRRSTIGLFKEKKKPVR